MNTGTIGRSSIRLGMGFLEIPLTREASSMEAHPVSIPSELPAELPAEAPLRVLRTLYRVDATIDPGFPTQRTVRGYRWIELPQAEHCETRSEWNREVCAILKRATGVAFEAPRDGVCKRKRSARGGVQWVTLHPME